MWLPNIPRSLWSVVRDLPVVSGRTAAETLARARRVDPGAAPESVRKTDGLLVVTLRLPDEQTQSFGKPAMTVRSESE